MMFIFLIVFAQKTSYTYFSNFPHIRQRFSLRFTRDVTSVVPRDHTLLLNVNSMAISVLSVSSLVTILVDF